MLKIRLARGGAKKRPYYSIVVADSHSPRDGRFIEKVGTYNPLLPKDGPTPRVTLKLESIQAWIAKGAQPTDRVARFLDAAGVLERAARNNPNKGVPGEKAKERAEEKAQKLADAEEAAAAAAAAPAPEPEVEAPAAEEVAAEAVAEAVADEVPADATAEDATAIAEEVAEGGPVAEEAPAAEAGEEKAEG